MTEGNDIGLLGYIIKNSLENKSIEIYGDERKRNILFIDDLIDIVFKISKKPVRVHSIKYQRVIA